MRCFSILVLAATAAVACATPHFRAQVMGADPIPSGLPTTTPPSAPSDGDAPALAGGNVLSHRPHAVSLTGGIRSDPNTPPAASETSAGNDKPDVSGGVLSTGTDRVFHPRGVSPNGGIMTAPAATTATKTLGNSVVSGRGTRTPSPTTSTGAPSQPGTQANANNAADTPGLGISKNGGITTEPNTTPGASETFDANVQKAGLAGGVHPNGGIASRPATPAAGANANTVRGFHMN